MAVYVLIHLSLSKTERLFIVTSRIEFSLTWHHKIVCISLAAADRADFSPSSVMSCKQLCKDQSFLTWLSFVPTVALALYSLVEYGQGSYWRICINSPVSSLDVYKLDSLHTVVLLYPQLIGVKIIDKSWK